MKIIFETEEEKQQFIEAGCPHDIPTVFYMNCQTECEYIEDLCKECWKNSGVILEVEHDESR